MKTLQWSSLIAIVSGVIAFLVLRMSFPDIDTAQFSQVIGLVAVAGAFAGVWFSRKGGGK